MQPISNQTTAAASQFASPVAKMSRRLVDGKGNVLYAGVTWYWGDGYVSEIDIPASA